jgi:hypothetical protein
LIFSSADERFARHLDVIIPALTSFRFAGGSSQSPLR